MSDTPAQIKDYSRATVFFDGGCPLCSREIAHYRKLDRNEELQWVDITVETELVKQLGLDHESLMQRFHVRDTRGNMVTGAWGFAEMWAHLPYYRWLSRFLRFTRLLPALDLLYSRFARWRVRKRCEDRCLLPPRGER